jgi:multiple sugar transport system substrate-binding protein
MEQEPGFIKTTFDKEVNQSQDNCSELIRTFNSLKGENSMSNKFWHHTFLLMVILALFASTSCSAVAETPASVEKPTEANTPVAVEKPTEVVADNKATVTTPEKSEASLDAWAEQIKSKYDGVELNLAFGTHPSTEAYQAMAADFTEKTGIKVHWDILDDVSLKDKQLLEYTGHTGTYDVLMMDGFWISEYAPKGVVISLDDYLANSDMTPAWYDYQDILPAFRNGLGMYKGTTYGVPTAGESRFLAYRKDLFEKYNQKVPTTLDEMLKVAEFFNGKEDGLYGMAFRGQKGIMFASGWLTLVYNFGDGFVDQKTWEARMNSADVKESLDYFTRLLKTAPPDVLNYTHEEATSAFVSGKTAMWYDATALVPWLEDPQRSQVVGKIGYAGPPKGPAGDGGVLAGWNMAISADSKKKDAAWAFIVYMTSKEMAMNYVENGGVPSRTSTLMDPGFRAKNPSAEAQLAAFDASQALIDKGLNWIPQTPVLGKLLDRIGYFGTLPLSEGMTIDKAMDQAQQEVTEILSEGK